MPRNVSKTGPDPIAAQMNALPIPFMI